MPVSGLIWSLLVVVAGVVSGSFSVFFGRDSLVEEKVAVIVVARKPVLEKVQFLLVKGVKSGNIRQVWWALKLGANIHMPDSYVRKSV